MTAVSQLTLSVAGGEVLGFLGPNGAGKTTTLRMLLGFINPTSGRCAVLGGSLRSQPELKRRVGYLPGDFRMDPGMTGWDLFSWFGSLRGGANRARITELIDRLHLDPTRPFSTLSKGNRQKIGLIQAFQHDPEVLVLDEPTTGLDPLMQREFLSLIREAAARGAAIIFSSHVLPEVERAASRVAIIRAGELVSISTVDELLDHTRHRLELRFADAVPPALFDGVLGVSAAEIDGRAAIITIDGPAGPAMKAAAAGPGLLRVSPAGDDLEELFVKLYERRGDD
ncbi:MAG: ABC transporter ATP-binding protein [Candidatus Dormibacteraeota bacterium]|nr:ABC transporter ATP-binding protein [Candidatus Dormibacteraeota bacterium]